MIHIKAPKFLRIVTGSESVRGLCLFNFLIYRDNLTPELINHETIHWQQYKELWIIGFLLLYFYYHFKVGYYQNPFEKEAYENDRNLKYLENRKPFYWRKFVK